MKSEDFPQRKSIRLPREAYNFNHAFFITISTFARYPWFHHYQEFSDITIQEMLRLSEQRGTKLFAWCLMPDHLHLLLQDNDIVEFVRLLKGKLSVVSRRLEPGRRLWQRSFYDHGLRKEESVKDVCMYIWNNPVRKGIVKTAGEYPWSGGIGFYHT